MKGSVFGKWLYMVCALAGCLAGAWIFTAADAKEIQPNTITKDNTLLRESEDSVFFDVSKEVTPVPTKTPAPTEQPAEVVQNEEKEPEKEAVAGQALITAAPDELPSLASQWAGTKRYMAPTPLPMVTPEVTEAPAEPPGQTAQVITYPAKIFGQTPVINRSDAYVSYFEFTYDLVTMLEPEVKQRGLNMTALMTKFAVKALLCGVDIEQLDINAPIPRSQAALTLWLAAGLLNEPGCETSAKTAQTYVTDISGCSSSEKKAVAYLYEQGIVSGYNTAGQKFYPDAGLKTEAGNSWLSKIKQRWK